MAEPTSMAITAIRVAFTPILEPMMMMAISTTMVRKPFQAAGSWEGSTS